VYQVGKVSKKYDIKLKSDEACTYNELSSDFETGSFHVNLTDLGLLIEVILLSKNPEKLGVQACTTLPR
jgi:hypothetical protein